jgi:hypothetical protein
VCGLCVYLFCGGGFAAEADVDPIQVDYPTQNIDLELEPSEPARPMFIDSMQMKEEPGDKPPEYQDTPGVAGMVPAASSTPAGLAPPLAPGWQVLPSPVTITPAVSPCPSSGTGDPGPGQRPDVLLQFGDGCDDVGQAGCWRAAPRLGCLMAC